MKVEASIFIIGLLLGYTTHVALTMPRTIPDVGPGEICHCDDAGRCSITRKGRLVTRVQIR